MDITPASSTTGSFGNTNSSNTTPLFDAYSCKPFHSGMNTTGGAKIFCYCVLLLLSVLGNSLLIVIIKKNKRMQKLTNYLIANMAVSDILITVLAVPRQITEILLGPQRWLIGGLLGSALCKSLSFFQDISTAVSILSLVVIAIDRYRGIVFPLRTRRIKHATLCKIIIPLIWITSMGLHAVYFYFFRIAIINAKTYCKRSWAPKFDDRQSQETYYLIVLVSLIVIPTFVITTLYSAIILNLKRSKTARHKGPSSCLTLRRLREDTKVVRIIIAILITFLVCIIPINVLAFMLYFVWAPGKVPCGLENVVFVVHFGLYSNASVNPIIYFILNDKYRKGLRDILKSFNIRKKDVVKRKSTVNLETPM